MRIAKGRLAPGDIAALFIAGTAAILAANLSMLALTIDSDSISNLLFLPMRPGLYAAYLLTAKSYPSPVQEAVAPYIAAAVNAALYAASVLAIRLIYRQLLLDPPSSSDPT